MSLFVDAKISHKILPKLHGNKKRVEPVLIDLAKFCETGALPDEKTNYATGFSTMPAVKRVEEPLAGESDPVMFRQSYGKVCDMLDAVRRDQYVSFIQ